jgi:hypothetical protein
VATKTAVKSYIRRNGQRVKGHDRLFVIPGEAEMLAKAQRLLFSLEFVQRLTGFAADRRLVTYAARTIHPPVVTPQKLGQRPGRAVGFVQGSDVFPHGIGAGQGFRQLPAFRSQVYTVFGFVLAILAKN